MVYNKITIEEQKYILKDFKLINNRTPNKDDIYKYNNKNGKIINVKVYKIFQEFLKNPDYYEFIKITFELKDEEIQQDKTKFMIVPTDESTLIEIFKNNVSKEYYNEYWKDKIIY